MTDDALVRGDAAVIHDDGGKSFWQPLPANGHAEVKISPWTVRTQHPFSMGLQAVAPGGYVRDHAHDRGEEVIHFVAGSGYTEIDGERHRVAPGTTLYLGPNRRHTFVNDGDVELKFVWFFLPGGLEDFFAAIGRERAPGEPAPAPFPRPADVKAIEARTVFSPALTK
jgi:quercetin dioxygenase-like cupin family protein